MAATNGVLLCSCRELLVSSRNIRHCWRVLNSYHTKTWRKGLKNKPLPSVAADVLQTINGSTINNDHVISIKQNITDYKQKTFKNNALVIKGLASHNKHGIQFEKENIWTIPNLLTISRIVASPIVGYLVITQHYSGAFGLFALASVTDVLDGLIARQFPSQSSRFGSILDPLADKCLVSILYISLTVVGLIPVPLTLLVLSRDLFLVSGAFYLRYLTLPPPKTWRRYWDVKRSGVQITPNLLGKVNTLLQLTLVGCTMGAPVFNYIDHPLLQLLWYITGCTTVLSGLTYTIQLKGFQIIEKQQKSKQNTS